jgi:hypothetical protein
LVSVSIGILVKKGQTLYNQYPLSLLHNRNRKHLLLFLRNRKHLLLFLGRSKHLLSFLGSNKNPMFFCHRKKLNTTRQI